MMHLSFETKPKKVIKKKKKGVRDLNCVLFFFIFNMRIFLRENFILNLTNMKILYQSMNRHLINKGYDFNNNIFFFIFFIFISYYKSIFNYFFLGGRLVRPYNKEPTRSNVIDGHEFMVRLIFL